MTRTSDVTAARAALQALVDALPIGMVGTFGGSSIDHTKLNAAIQEAKEALALPQSAVEATKETCASCGADMAVRCEYCRAAPPSPALDPVTVEAIAISLDEIIQSGRAHEASSKTIASIIINELLARRALLTSPTPSNASEGVPVAWGRVIGNKAVTVSLNRTGANDEPLYAAPASNAKEANT